MNYTGKDWLILRAVINPQVQKYQCGFCDLPAIGHAVIIEAIRPGARLSVDTCQNCYASLVSSDGVPPTTQHEESTAVAVA